MGTDLTISLQPYHFPTYSTQFGQIHHHSSNPMEKSGKNCHSNHLLHCLIQSVSDRIADLIPIHRPSTHFPLILALSGQIHRKSSNPRLLIRHTSRCETRVPVNHPKGRTFWAPTLPFPSNLTISRPIPYSSDKSTTTAVTPWVCFTSPATQPQQVVDG